MKREEKQGIVPCGGSQYDFSYGFYVRLLRELKKEFCIEPMAEARAVLMERSDTKCVFVRHDVDVDLSAALEMARIENREGIKATYMILTSSPFYSVETAVSRSMLTELSDLGHDIGLHLDASAGGPLSALTLQQQINDRTSYLEERLGVSVHSFSYHRPNQKMMGGPLEIGGRVSAYAAALTGWILSDSAGVWRDGDPLAGIRRPRGNLLQLSVHPIWWGIEHKSVASIMKDFVRRRCVADGDMKAVEAALISHLGMTLTGERI